MNNIQFYYRKEPENITERKAIVLSKPTKNYLTLDVTTISEEDRERLEKGLKVLQKEIDEAFSHRTKWLRDNGFNTYFRSFNKDKMSFTT